jgi:hypothetical protein
MSEKNAPHRNEEAFKFLFWAIGIGAGTVFMILTYAFATFSTKDASASNQKLNEQKISTLENAVSEIKSDNKDFQKWLRDNWHKRKPDNK